MTSPIQAPCRGQARAVARAHAVAPAVADGRYVDTLADGRGFRMLEIVDNYTREWVVIEVNRSLPGLRDTRVFDRLAATVGLPVVTVVDIGPEFAGRVLDDWTYQHGVTLGFIRPGRPVDKTHIESFNGKFPAECLNEHWFVSRLACRSRSKCAAGTTTPSDRTVRWTTRRRRLLPTFRRWRRLALTTATTQTDSHYPCSRSKGQVHQSRPMAAVAQWTAPQHTRPLRTVARPRACRASARPSLRARAVVGGPQAPALGRNVAGLLAVQTRSGIPKGRVAPLFLVGAAVVREDRGAERIVNDSGVVSGRVLDGKPVPHRGQFADQRVIQPGGPVEKRPILP